MYAFTYQALKKYFAENHGIKNNTRLSKYVRENLLEKCSKEMESTSFRFFTIFQRSKTGTHPSRIVNNYLKYYLLIAQIT